MPDGDRIHPKLDRFYEKPYKETIENHFPPQVIARDFAWSLLQSFEKYGTPSCIKPMSELLKEAQSEYQNGSLGIEELNWASLPIPSGMCDAFPWAATSQRVSLAKL